MLTATTPPAQASLTKATISVNSITKSFGEHEVLRGVNLSVASGSIHALLGANGAGKTTLIKILTTLTKPTSGAASIAGFDTTTQAENVRSSISLTGQFSAVDGILTGQENLELIARLRNLSQPKKVAHDLLERFSLTDATDRRVATYSGGMVRRLDIAMSLIGAPKVVFLDEPTTGLDPSARREVWDAVTHLRDNGTTVLLTTQYLDEAEKLADRISILHEGIIQVEGTLDDLEHLLPPKKIEYVEKRPTLEDIFLALIGGKAGTK